ncbi:MAG TPA: hypothetical protein VNA87_07400 [Actinomycetota bacterium]|nr:hypothetical protein [Actinomycetota bacterium]
MDSIVFVCTGNICRSPMAHAFCSQIIGQRDLEVEVASAGVLEAGSRPTREGIEAMSEHGLDISPHRSSTIEEGLVPPPDLVIAMARDHSRRIADLWPELWPRTFTLKEFVRLAAQTGPRWAEEDVEAYLARVGSHRRISQLASMVSREDDVEDPIGRGLSTYRNCAREIKELVNALVELLWPETMTEPGIRPPSG